ncbi:putative Kunitz-type serine protease inhibitor [Patagioenas fasciata]|uniref:putative Kunitz-type serine protease inhibitor n=1 Tax=Patagioenas fasciata TaxID=372321 RepID=UPI003A991970
MAPGLLLPLLLSLLFLHFPGAAATATAPGPNGPPPLAPKPPQHQMEPLDADPAYAEYCRAPRVTGPCRAAFRRWFYVPANQTCREFTYGGCRGNKNNYLNEEECWSRCGPKPDDADGTDWRGGFFSTKALALGVLLAILAAILFGYITDVAIKTCRRKTEAPGTGAIWSPPDDKEYLMSNVYTL